MSRNNTRYPAGMLGVALAGLVLGGSAFAIEPLPHGYMLAAGHAAGEGKCGEGKCGAGAAKTAKSAPAEKTAEGKCGEGQCGDARFAVVPNGEAIFATKDPNGDGFISEKEAYQNVKKAYNANGKEIPRGLFADIPE
jgi:uncharacterized low-complexity protein